MDEFLTLLDTTLHLPEPSVSAVSDTPAPRQAFIDEQGELAYPDLSSFLEKALISSCLYS